ncbi:hypothetical protein MiAbB_03748 [Microcystis aeruginosa NIES-4285]|uniref:Uncharacterized protein n=1 Tax=Microcystis aeruginosa NIES-4285 TaxID=2497681 RepID=A0A402DHW0_MICAE|nr:hypothetical protein MiAbB_03748 [Microcystis aeruginosa NIES-4285]
MGFSQKAKGKGEEKQVYLTSLGNAISLGFFEIKKWGKFRHFFPEN